MTIKIFKQNVRQFLASKTNWTGLTMIVSAFIGYQTGAMDAVSAWQTAASGLGLIFIRDAIAGAK